MADGDVFFEEGLRVGGNCPLEGRGEGQVLGWLAEDVRKHRTIAAAFVVWVQVVWVITLATWVFDQRSVPVGMHPVGLVLNLALPIGAGALVGWWWLDEPGGRRGVVSSAERGMIGGMLAMEASLLGELVLWMVVYRLILGRPLAEVTGGMLGGLTELVEFVVLAANGGLVLGGIGGAVSGLVRAVR